MLQLLACVFTAATDYRSFIAYCFRKSLHGVSYLGSHQDLLQTEPKLVVQCRAQSLSSAASTAHANTLCRPKRAHRETCLRRSEEVFDGCAQAVGISGLALGYTVSSLSLLAALLCWLVKSNLGCQHLFNAIDMPCCCVCSRQMGRVSEAGA